MKMIFLEISILFVMLGAAHLYYNNDYSTLLGKEKYYLWDKIKDFLLFGSLFLLSNQRRLKWIYGLIAICMFLRAGWEVFEIINYDYANRSFFLDKLFVACIATILFINIVSINDSKKYRKKNGRT